jgi:hypothetical protein
MNPINNLISFSETGKTRNGKPKSSPYGGVRGGFS